MKPVEIEVSETIQKSEVLDHHGLVAGICRELRIAECIDEHLGGGGEGRVVSAGTSVVAMIINGLGFTHRRLYLTPQFYETKPVEQLLGKGLKASDLNDHTLGKALDEIFAYGATSLFASIACAIAREQGLLKGPMHLDTTRLFCMGSEPRLASGP